MEREAFPARRREYKGAAGPGQGAEGALPLFPGVVARGAFTEVGKVLDMDTWSGSLDDGGYFLGARSQDTVIFHVATKKGVFEVSRAGANAYRVIELDQSKNKEDAPRPLTANPIPTKAQSDALAADPNADASSQIDVMVIASRQAMLGEGTLAALKARTALAVQEANQSYRNSNVHTQLRLTHFEQTTYNENGDFDTDLARLVNPSDGQLDFMHTVRNYYAADMVGLVLESGAWCGLASGIMATQATAFMTVSRGCMTGYYSFAHEFGHLQGARHDTYVDSTNTPYADGHGYTLPAKGWRTIMAYNNACSDVGKN